MEHFCAYWREESDDGAQEGCTALGTGTSCLKVANFPASHFGRTSGQRRGPGGPSGEYSCLPENLENNP